MTWLQRGRGVGALFTGVMAAALLALPRPAAAHEALCYEIWNPHGQTTPPAGWTTAPGTENRSTPENPDGFYQVGACSILGQFECPTGLGGPEFAGLCTCTGDAQPEPVTVRDGCPGETGGGTNWYFDGDPSTPCNQTTGAGCEFAFGSIIKYTEANGKTPDQDEMAGSGQPGSPAGDSSDSVDWHLWGQGDAYVCSSVDPAFCICCHVPPPPFTCEGSPLGCPDE